MPEPAPASDPLQLYTYRADVLRVIDGDTYLLSIDLGFYVSTEAHVRLRGADCPELSTPEGRAARDELTRMIGGKTVLVRTQKTPDMSFARYVADVFLEDGTPLAPLLIDRGLAVPMQP